MWCVPRLTDEFVERMKDVLNLYEKSYIEDEPVLCIDEKPLQLLDHSRAPIPVKKSGMIKKIDYEYKRKGTANIFSVVEPKAGRHYAYVSKRKTGIDFAKILYRISRNYVDTRTIHLVMDNYSTHSFKSLVKRYGETKAKMIWDRFTIHYTPKHASWLNQAEIEIGILSRQCLGSRRFGSICELRTNVNAWKKRINKKKVIINWKFTTKDAMKKFKLES